ncbi:hypothetical protein J1614_005109 [Plenodomus biglobosus]|nr:hypothetical protein J1614_005109 [Plenodomus biglobosus]
MHTASLTTTAGWNCPMTGEGQPSNDSYRRYCSTTTLYLLPDTAAPRFYIVAIKLALLLGLHVNAVPYASKPAPASIKASHASHEHLCYIVDPRLCSATQNKTRTRHNS